MNHRENLKECFQERLEATMHDVKVIMNQIERMESQYKSISPSVIEKDLATSYCDLELSMALMAVIIRKMVENQYVTITNSERQDINALIHSNRLDYKDGKVHTNSIMNDLLDMMSSKMTTNNFEEFKKFLDSDKKINNLKRYKYISFKFLVKNIMYRLKICIVIYEER